jgi:hypothetical protein
VALDLKMIGESWSHTDLNFGPAPFTDEYLYLYLKRHKYDALGCASSIFTAINPAVIKDIEITIPNDSSMQRFIGTVRDCFCVNTQSNENPHPRNPPHPLPPKLISSEARIRT